MKIRNNKEMVIRLSHYLSAAAVAIAVIEANVPCPYLTYQPSKPDSVRKLRKF